MALELKLKVDGGKDSDFARAVRGRLEEETQAAQQRVAKAHTAAMNEVVRRDLAELRADIANAGFYNSVKLSKTWRGRKEPATAAMCSTRLVSSGTRR